MISLINDVTRIQLLRVRGRVEFPVERHHFIRVGAAVPRDADQEVRQSGFEVSQALDSAARSGHRAVHQNDPAAITSSRFFANGSLAEPRSALFFRRFRRERFARRRLF